MRRTSKGWKLMVPVLLWLASPPTALAQREAPSRSFTQVAGEYVFVMLAEDAAPLASSTGKTYPSSGLYPNDGSAEPLWTVDWYAAEVYPSSDGHHLAEMGSRPALKGKTRDLSLRAVAFYEDGKLVKEYDIGDVVQQPDVLPKTTTHFDWRRQVVFDDRAGRLAIRTLDGQTFEFEMATGRIMTQHHDRVRKGRKD
jgi:hypothetical protein